MGDRTVVLDDPLSIEDLVAVARGGARLELGAGARERMEASLRALERIVEEGRPVYGLTTGLGAFDGVRVDHDERARAQRHLLRAHAAAVGDPMPRERVRAMMASRANVLARGASAVHVEIVSTLLEMLERDVVPQVPSRGSVGASDLAPLAHMALVVAGEGRATFGGELLPGAEAMARAGIALPGLRGRDGVALINGLDQTLGTAALVVHDARRAIALSESAAAIAIAAWGGATEFLDARLAERKGHAGQLESAARMRALLEGTAPRDHAGIRTPLSMRYAAHVAGACRDALGAAEHAVATELRAVVDNPIVEPDGFVTNDSGLTSGQRIGEALHALATSLASLAVAGERRMALLFTPSEASALPPFLVPDDADGTRTGPMMAQYTAASLVAELRTRSAPASVGSIPTGAGTEDHVSMCALEAAHAAWVVETVEVALALELLVAAEALAVSGRSVPEGLAHFYEPVERAVPVAADDRVVADDCARLLELIRADALG